MKTKQKTTRFNKKLATLALSSYLLIPQQLSNLNDDFVLPSSDFTSISDTFGQDLTTQNIVEKLVSDYQVPLDTKIPVLFHLPKGKTMGHFVYPRQYSEVKHLNDIEDINRVKPKHYLMNLTLEDLLNGTYQTPSGIFQITNNTMPADIEFIKQLFEIQNNVKKQSKHEISVSPLLDSLKFELTKINNKKENDAEIVVISNKFKIPVANNNSLRVITPDNTKKKVETKPKFTYKRIRNEYRESQFSLDELTNLEVSLIDNNSDINRYDALIDEISSKYGLDPLLMKAKMFAESGFNPNAVSKKNAKGLLQLMNRTANYYNVEDVLSPAQNIDGASRYMAYLLKKFNNNVELAVAAYNAGQGNVIRYQGVPEFRETKRHVKRVLNEYERLKQEELETVKANKPKTNTLSSKAQNRIYAIKVAKQLGIESNDSKIVSASAFYTQLQKTNQIPLNDTTKIMASIYKVLSNEELLNRVETANNPFLKMANLVLTDYELHKNVDGQVLSKFNEGRKTNSSLSSKLAQIANDKHLPRLHGIQNNKPFLYHTNRTYNA